MRGHEGRIGGSRSVGDCRAIGNRAVGGNVRRPGDDRAVRRDTPGCDACDYRRRGLRAVRGARRYRVDR